MRSIESAAIQLLRTIEARAADDRIESVHVDAAPEVALYLLNEKRSSIAAIEADCHVSVRIEADEELKAGEFKIEGRAEGNVVQPRPMQPIDLRKLKPLPPPAPDEIEDEEDEIVDDSDDESEDDQEGRDHEDEEGDSEEDSSSDADDDDDEDRSPRGRRGRRGGRRRRTGGRDNVREMSGMEIVEPSEETTPIAARDDGGRDDGRGRGGRRRRRGGRDRDRGERNRIPDIAADGGEMLDAIASAPFLMVVTPQEAQDAADAPDLAAERASANEMPFETSAVGAVPVFEIPPESAPEPQETQATEHEIAASEPEAPKVDEPVEQSVTESAQAEVKRHAIHGTPEEPAPVSDTPPRKMGWWNRRKAG